MTATPKPCQWCDAPTRPGHALCVPCEREEAERDDYDYEPTPEEEAEAEFQWSRSQARAEWDHYHPGEPCPEIELPQRRATPSHNEKD